MITHWVREIGEDPVEIWCLRTNTPTENYSDYCLFRLREKRNQLLAQTDWRMVSDYPGSNQTEWQTYRQALRDITTQTPSLDADGNLTGVNWPTPPTD